jgi:hypothetical protein
VGLPLILAIPGVTGGALGTGFAIGAVIMNSRAARFDLPALPRALAMIGITAGFIVAYFVVGLLLIALIEPRSSAAG